jgi:hypothetical protein
MAKLTDAEKIKRLQDAIKPFADVGAAITNLSNLLDDIKAGRAIYEGKFSDPETAASVQVTHYMDNLKAMDALEAYKALLATQQ